MKECGSCRALSYDISEGRYKCLLKYGMKQKWIGDILAGGIPGGNCPKPLTLKKYFKIKYGGS